MDTAEAIENPLFFQLNSPNITFFLFHPNSPISLKPLIPNSKNLKHKFNETHLEKSQIELLTSGE